MDARDVLEARGATTTGPDASPPSYLSKLGGGGGWGAVGGGPLGGVGGGGGRLQGLGGWGSAGGCVGGGGGSAMGGGVPKVGGLRVTHYYHMHTSRGEVCLGRVWGSCWWLL